MDHPESSTSEPTKAKPKKKYDKKHHSPFKQIDDDYSDLHYQEKDIKVNKY